MDPFLSLRPRRIGLLFLNLLVDAPSSSLEDSDESPMSADEDAPPKDKGVADDLAPAPLSSSSSSSSSDWTGVWKLSSFVPRLLAVDKSPEESPKKPLVFRPLLFPTGISFIGEAALFPIPVPPPPKLPSK